MLKNGIKRMVNNYREPLWECPRPETDMEVSLPRDRKSF
jgi:hypothetical protein